MNESLPVVVVGGGPAGLASAISLTLRGASVLVLEPRAMPIDKPCGEGLMPDAVLALSALGVELGDAGRAIRGISYFDRGLEARGRFPGSPGRGVRRLELHRRLRDRALEVGVEIRRERVLGLEPRTTARDIAVLATSAGETEASLVVGADGLRSKVRAWAGLDGGLSSDDERPGGAARGRPSRRRSRHPRRFGVRRHFAVAPWSEQVEVHWSTGVEAYVTPCGPGEVGVAVLFDEQSAVSEISETSGGPVLDRLLGRFPALESRLRDAETTSSPRGIGPLRQKCRSVLSADRGPVVLIGDASGYLDAITGEGMAIAFQQALALGEAFAHDRLDHYAAAHRRLVRRPNCMTRLVLLLSSRPRLRRRVFRVLEKDPQLFERLLAIHVGEARSFGILSSAARLGLGLAVARG